MTRKEDGKVQESFVKERIQKESGKPDENLMPEWVPSPEV